MKIIALALKTLIFNDIFKDQRVWNKLKTTDNEMQ